MHPKSAGATQSQSAGRERRREASPSAIAKDSCHGKHQQHTAELRFSKESNPLQAAEPSSEHAGNNRERDKGSKAGLCRAPHWVTAGR